MDLRKLLLSIIIVTIVATKLTLELKIPPNMDVYKMNLTEHFQNWLDDNRYGSFDFAGKPGYSFGGKRNDSDVLVN